MYGEETETRTTWKQILDSALGYDAVCLFCLVLLLFIKKSFDRSSSPVGDISHVNVVVL